MYDQYKCIFILKIQFVEVSINYTLVRNQSGRLFIQSQYLNRKLIIYSEVSEQQHQFN